MVLSVHMYIAYTMYPMYACCVWPVKRSLSTTGGAVTFTSRDHWWLALSANPEVIAYEDKVLSHFIHRFCPLLLNEGGRGELSCLVHNERDWGRARRRRKRGRVRLHVHTERCFTCAHYSNSLSLISHVNMTCHSINHVHTCMYMYMCFVMRNKGCVCVALEWASVTTTGNPWACVCDDVVNVVVDAVNVNVCCCECWV